MFLRLIAVLALSGMLSAAGLGQRPGISRAALDTDIRVFTVAAALKVATSEDGDKFVTSLEPDLVRRLKQFYTNHKGNRSDESQLAQYAGLALNLTDPPELKPRYREEQLPDDVRALLAFPELLREFYLKAHLSQQFESLKPLYEAEMSRLQPKVGQTFLQVDAYLRSTLDAGSPSVMHIIPEILASPNSVSMRVLDSDYYVIVGPSITGNMDDIRHAYLHFRLDGVVKRGVSKLDNEDKYLNLIAGQQGVNPAYAKDFIFMADESLIRAMELRIDRSTIAHAQDVLASAYRSGLLLAPYFYESLSDFQSGTLSFPDHFRRMAQAIDLKTETNRFQTTFHNIAISEQPAGPDVPETVTTPLDPIRKQLIEAQTAFNSNDNDGARALFEKVLRTDANNGAALYGLALIASRANDVEQSQIYFERTVKSSSADPSMKVWAYIYLGHIADLQCKRDKAKEYYRQAIQIGDNTRDAQTAANNGLGKAFGDQCR
jgi:tetratricopeptide (TPR) repeat protein